MVETVHRVLRALGILEKSCEAWLIHGLLLGQEGAARPAPDAERVGSHPGTVTARVVVASGDRSLSVVL